MCPRPEAGLSGGRMAEDKVRDSLAFLPLYVLTSR